LKKAYRTVKVVTVIILLMIVGMLLSIYLLDDYSVYVVMSDSMKPTFSSGDMVVVAGPGSFLSADIEPGKIITFTHNNNVVTHRVVLVEGDRLYTKGDGQEEIDPWTVSRFFDVKGSYIFHVPYIGLVSNFIRTKTGWLVSVIVPALVLLMFIVIEIIKEVRQRYKYAH
jgi:signal peptidase